MVLLHKIGLLYAFQYAEPDVMHTSGDAYVHVQAARAASSAAARTPLVEEAGDQDEERELPAFGSGLEFRPQGKLAASKGGAAAAEAARRANDGSLAISLEEETEEVVEDDMGDAEQVRS